jgi:hypothetical protein
MAFTAAGGRNCDTQAANDGHDRGDSCAYSVSSGSGNAFSSSAAVGAAYTPSNSSDPSAQQVASVIAADIFPPK